MRLSDDRLVQYVQGPTLGEVWAKLDNERGRKPDHEEASDVSEALPAADSSSTVAPVDPVSIAQFASEHLPAIRFRLRLVAEPCPFPPRDLLDRPPAVADYFYRHLGHEPQEVMVAAYLDTRNRLIGWQELFRGTVDRIKVEPRQLLQTALMVNAHCFLLCHCHPSGNTDPSTEDLAFTQRVREASRIVGIPLSDHMIVGHGGSWTSIKRRGPW